MTLSTSDMFALNDSLAIGEHGTIGSLPQGLRVRAQTPQIRRIL
jgi:hypothetical protein